MTSHLEIQAPSSTTVCYHVRNNKQSSSRTLGAVKHALRLIVAFHVSLLILAKVNGTVPSGLDVRPLTEALFSLTFLDSVIFNLAVRLNWGAATALSIVVLYLCVRRDYTGKDVPRFRE